MATMGSADNSTATDITPTKRKHTTERPLTNGSKPAFDAQYQRDVLDILQRHDSNPSFLEHEFKLATEHTTKRAKLSNTAATSISAKLSKQLYHSLEELGKDAATVSDAIIEQVRSKAQDEESESSRPTIEALKRIQRAKMIRQEIENLVHRELRYSTPTAIKEEEGIQDAIKSEPAQEGTVLTLFGNAPGPKQLFSSLQNTTTTADGLTTKPSISIEELSLPNGLTTTKIKPYTSLTTEKPITFAEAFAPAYSLPTLTTPKPAKRPSTRDNTLLWEFRDNTRGTKRGGYTTQSQSTADWLSYGGAALSSRDRRKQRERTLSQGHASLDNEDPSELAKQEEALFRQAYSSYAPAYDNSKSVVDINLKNLVWWHKIGHKKYDARFGLDPALTEFVAADSATDEAIDDSGFAKAVEDFTEEPELDETKSVDLTNAEEVLTRITSLLQTLASMQVIRNAALPSSTLSKTPISPASGANALPTSDVPDKDEIDTYEQLQREIAYLILQLPPYAVAKLNGNQLADLGVSRIITFEKKSYRGQMEEDAAARLARQTAAATAAGIASLTRSTSSKQPYSISRPPTMPQPNNTRYAVNTGYGNRTPASAPVPQRPLMGQQSFSTPTAAPRQYNPATAGYSKPGMPQSYGQTNGQYQQRPNSQSYGYNATFSASQGQRAVQPAGQTFQPRSQTAAVNAVSYQTAPQGSPPKPAASPVSYVSPAQTPINGMQSARAPPPLLARATSGTPQPNDINGHA